MSNESSGLRPPLSSDPVHLQRWGFDLVNRLRQRAEEVDNRPTGGGGGDDTSAETAIQDLISTYGTITNFDNLTDPQKASLGLSLTVADQLNLGSDVLAEIEAFTDTPGLAAVHAYLRAHQNEAGIRVEQTVRQTETLSLSNQVTTLTANLASTNAALVSEQTARADGDTALASDITTLQTTVAGHDISITQHQASLDGIEAEWGVTINAQGQVVGLIRLDADQSESTFTVVVDKFQVAKTDGTGVVPIFQIGTVDGVSRVALAGDMLVDGYIGAQQIAANAITADKIQANTITASKIVVSDRSNMVPDNAMVDDGAWLLLSGAGYAWTLEDGTASESAARVVQLEVTSPLTGTANAYFSESQALPEAPIDPTKSYVIGGSFRAGAGASGRMFVGPVWLDESLNFVSGPFSIEFNTAITTQQTGVQIVTPPASARYVRWRARAAYDASGNIGGTHRFYNAFLRPAVNADLIVDGAITANKLNVSSLSAISANIGTVTAGKMESTDGKMVIDLDNKIISIET